MPDLFDPERHEPLGEAGWDANRARRAIEAIVAEVRTEASEAGTWAIHPREEAAEGTPPYRNLYLGSAGVTLGLDHLIRIGAAAPGPIFADRLGDHLEVNRRMLAGLNFQTRSYLMGDAGIRLIEWRTTAASEAADHLAAVVAENVDDPALEMMWGAPGTMLATLAMHRWTGEARWAELYRQGVEALDRARVDDEAGGVIWVQDLYGRKGSYLGAVHGFAGIAFALIAGRELTEPQAWSRWSASLARTLEATALHGEAGVNWAPGVGATQVPMVVQICHGAPGMIYGFAGLDEPIDDLLVGAGELVWRAGPLIKGANFCHGTDGNGYAFLKLFERTGDQLWLDRARAFAMHAVAQSDAEAKAVGRRRATLWTGDIGLAAYLADCIDGRCRFPSLEFDA
ncbi:MAG TPA: LanC-like protein [Caulobacteraceae bacterium]|nr:LanC-like protein [Caulobacteraceae bacterium]